MTDRHDVTYVLSAVLLLSAANRLAAVMQNATMVARWGGDEFVVLGEEFGLRAAGGPG